MISIGLDLSLTHTGYAIVGNDGVVHYSGVIKSKPNGDKPYDETIRIMEIVKNIILKLGTAGVVPIAKNLDDEVIVSIEGLAFMAKGTSLVQLSALNYMVRAELVKANIPFIIVAPATLKKFITGSGKGDKDMIMMSLYKNYGHEALDNNEADAFGLAMIGHAVTGNPIKKLGVPQQEVVNILKKQI